MVDCCPKSHGCRGGLQTHAFKYYKKHNAILEEDYTYTAKTGKCHEKDYNPTEVKTQSYVSVHPNDVAQMKEALKTRVLATLIEADQKQFQYYKSGIFNDKSCGTVVDHATNVVGWGIESGTEYWIMRNSWSNKWGEDGYMRIEIQPTGKGICAIQHGPLYPTI